ncbi:hypothetical protein A2415_01545 [candidate division WWE3 bacterium RIFOXYC1_FULL_39_7]|uniref:Uncharacterized protein n=2 Tax=Katanobacteria TaxID=422282 RepID=A0A1F4X522_UNCKA|nr:MAG: hypothetical protein A2415_01545 [candidate division WWE3 bacterium RIFOXYC1_FULL_39_7]OGC76785.1 MAG: hypothetical protein A2619_00470 [candidate division WWE3 bacterium RIFOXYD1_FULL_39_9]
MEMPLSIQGLLVTWDPQMGDPTIKSPDETVTVLIWQHARIIIVNGEVITQTLSGTGFFIITDAEGTVVVEQRSSGQGNSSQTVQATNGSTITGVKQTRN